MGNRLAGKVAIVTGAGTDGPGIGNGKAAAIVFAREGAHVLLLDRDGEAAEETRRVITEEGGEAETFVGDVSVAADCKRMAEACLERFGRIDVLHNNAGITGGGGGPVETSEESWDRVVGVNLKGIFLTCKYVLPAMERQAAGSIINISTVGAIRARIGRPAVAYSASKAGIEGLSRDVAIQYASKGIRSNVIVLGGVATPRIVSARPGVDVDELLRKRGAMLPGGKLGESWDAAYAALFLASDESRHVTGTTLTVDGGQSAAIHVAIVDGADAPAAH
jgi:NAD(P)-dependent dehydrogenase (short-subunit alcohol dehydrogenase family)